MSVYLWGAFDFESELKRSVQSDRKVDFAVRVPLAPELEADPVVQIACGLKHCVVVTAGGSVFGFGNNTHGQLGQHVGEFTFKPLRLRPATSVKCIQAACGYRHTVLLYADGTVYTAGNNELSQLGRKRGNAKDFVPIELDGIPSSIVSAGDTNFALLNSGHVYSWGHQLAGSLGHGSTGMKDHESITNSSELKAKNCENIVKPELIQWFAVRHAKVLQVSAGPEHMLARTADELFAVGSGDYGRLGLGTIAQHLVPKRITFPERAYPEKLEQCSAGVYHSVALRTSAEFGSIIYIWGRVGSTPDGDLVPRIVECPHLTAVRTIRAGFMCSFLTTQEGHLYGWGTNPTIGSLGIHGEYLTAGGKKGLFPTPLHYLHDKFIADFASSQYFMVAVGDNTKLAAGGHREVVVPLAGRYSAVQLRSKSDEVTYEERRDEFLAQVLDSEEALEKHIASLPRPPVVAEEGGPVYTPQGTAAIDRGSKVRVWVGNVYALGTVLKKASAGSNTFLVRWARDDWEEEEVELKDADETLDPANEDRWQLMWFPEHGQPQLQPQA
jgi:alpha-tubulin suppressor-like RCC1 family protein